MTSEPITSPFPGDSAAARPHGAGSALSPASDHLSASMRALGEALEDRVRALFEPSPVAAPPTPPVPDPEDDSPYARFATERALDAEGRLLLALVFAPWVEPGFLDGVVQGVLTEAVELPQVGGVRGVQHRGLLPTGDTALFLLAGLDLAARGRWQALLRGDHPLVAGGVVHLEEAPPGEPAMSGRLNLDSEVAEQLLTGHVRPPRLSFRFPARRLKTERTWDDLVLPASTRAQIAELEAWVRHEHELMDGWGMGRKLAPGCRALFHGPPGTGKTFTATLLGQATGRPVFRVDLSMVISKYIGETEKNLGRLFDKAESKDWILFFDEADALFGKRTQVRDSHDRYANQEVSFLLQRVETFPGLVLLASNLAHNVDAAFARRFEHTVYFPMPRRGERRLLWERGLPEAVPLEPGADLDRLAASFEVSGGTIMNAIRHACLQALATGRDHLAVDDLVTGVRRELAKENRLE